jgi:hypothetical protein
MQVMKPIVIAIKGEHGFLFEGEQPRTFTFVPQEYVMFREDGSIGIDRVAYAAGGWAVWNMRFNTVDLSGTLLFPNEHKLVIKSDAPGLRVFLNHLRLGYGTRYSEGITALSGLAADV